uniref:Uncharacterized protein n=1 Tax=Siphoviridae sp. ct37J14 TaxID=2826280 RepID=A0A8S5M0J9_9CAUD|nr:MAG TPA: hypothetical protein [Siphoviridae sp. ct37J14]
MALDTRWRLINGVLIVVSRYILKLPVATTHWRL